MAHARLALWSGIALSFTGTRYAWFPTTLHRPFDTPSCVGRYTSIRRNMACMDVWTLNYFTIGGVSKV